MSIQIDSATLVSEIKQNLAERQRGTMFIRTSDGHSFAIAMEDGTITGVSAGLTLGNDAVAKLRTVKHASYHLSHTPFKPPGSKPDSVHVSLLLGRNGAKSSTTVGKPSAGSGSEFHQRALAVIESNLLDVLGPFAPMALDDALTSASFEYVDSDNLQQFLSTLVRDIDEDEQAERFIQNTISALKENGI